MQNTAGTRLGNPTQLGLPAPSPTCRWWVPCAPLRPYPPQNTTWHLTLAPPLIHVQDSSQSAKQ